MNKQELKKELSALRIRLELVSDDATYQSKLTGASVRDAIAKIDIAIGHIEDER